MSVSTQAAETARKEMSAGFAGELIGPAHPEYDEARKVYNAMIDRRPAIVARCTSPADVASGVRFAARHDLPLAIRSGGHNGAGLGTVDGGIVLDLSPMNRVTVDPSSRTVEAQGGAQLGQVDAATGEHGLATPFGIIATTGVGGLTLGGGIGHLTRKHGLTIDNLLSAEMITADGEMIMASEDENPDVFWAIRGGGGNFGVVTSFRFQAHPVSTVLAGPTFWPIERSAEILRWYRDFIGQAPRELNGFFAYLTVPPGPPFPEELHLKKVAGIVWCYTGDPAQADDLFAPVLELDPLMHGVGEAPFAAFQSAFDPIYPKGHQWYWRADFVRDIPDEAIAAHAEHGAKLPTWQSTMHLYPIDGAAAEVAPDATAWRHREARWAQVIVGVDPDPANADMIRQWTVDYYDATHPYSSGGAYVNFMMDEGADRVQATYGENYGRLQRIKAAVDPDNVFRVNQNIPPAS